MIADSIGGVSRLMQWTDLIYDNSQISHILNCVVVNYVIISFRNFLLLYLVLLNIQALRYAGWRIWKRMFDMRVKFYIKLY